MMVKLYREHIRLCARECESTLRRLSFLCQCANELEKTCVRRESEKCNLWSTFICVNLKACTEFTPRRRQRSKIRTILNQFVPKDFRQAGTCFWVSAIITRTASRTNGGGRCRQRNCSEYSGILPHHPANSDYLRMLPTRIVPFLPGFRQVEPINVHI